MRKRTAALLIPVAGALAAAGPAGAAIWDAVNGYADLTAVQSEAGGLRDETFRQDYNGNVTYNLFPYLELRGALRYYKFDQDLDASLGSYREEIMPSGEMRWTHPLFTWTASASQRRVKPPLTGGRIFTNEFQSTLKTRDIRYPILGLRYEQQHSYTTDEIDAGDIRYRRLQATADYTTGEHLFNYSYSRNLTDNVISGLKSTADRHLARWSGSAYDLKDGRLQLSGLYHFNYGIQTDEVVAGQPVLDLLRAANGLYAWDDAPEFGALNGSPALVDGNRTEPVLPAIDIGGAGTNQNLGADLGGPSAVGAAYVYTDRPSGSQVRWRVYVSRDNLNWTDWSTAPSQFFNPLFNRYEITFPTGTFRYVKLVNSGLNEVAQVLVTEVEILQELVATGTEQRIRSAHQASGRAGYRLTDRINGSLDTTYGQDRTHSADDTRQRYNYAVRLRYDQHPKISHHLRWEQSWQDYSSAQPDLRDDVVSYTMALTPLPTLRGSFSLSDRMSRLDGVRGQDVLSGAGESSADLLPGLDVNLSGGISKIRDFTADTDFVSANLNAGAEIALTADADVSLNQHFIRTRNQKNDEIATRRGTTVTADVRLTRSIFVRGSLRFLAEHSESLVQDYLVSWNLSPSFRLSAQQYGIRNNGTTTTERRSVNANLDLGTRSTVYLRAAEVDLSGSGGTRTVSYQQGFRMGF